MKYVMNNIFKSAIGLFIIAGMIGFACVQAAENNNMNESSIIWHPWSEAIFEQAKRENKLLILDLEAVMVPLVPCDG